MHTLRNIAVIFILLCSETMWADDIATVYFYRYKVFRGSASTAKVYVDGREVGKLKNGHWIAVTISSGLHRITGPNKDRGVETPVEPGKSYYFKIEPATWNGWVFTPISEQQGAFEIQKLTH